ncbi:MAG: beta-L-arabinofuranosidase domain-containing protein [Bacteroidales bacterium]
MKIFNLISPFAIVVLFSACSIPGSDELPNENPKMFPLSAVRLLDSPFKHASELNAGYVMAHDPDRLLAPFLIDAGLETRAPGYGNWENTGLDGHTAGHYLTSLALMVASQDNEEARDRLEYMVSELARCQEANGNGYVGGIPGGLAVWKEIGAGNIRAGGFSLNGKWVPLYNIHKLFAGLYDAYVFANSHKALEVLIGLSDFFVDMCNPLSDEQMQTMLISEHGGMNEALANLYHLTGNENYLKLAKRFTHKAILNPLLVNEDRLTGLHANTQIPKVIGIMRIAELTGDDDWEAASRFFWRTVVENRSVAIGGNSTHEHFHPTDDFSSMIETREGPETCNTYNMMKLSRLLYRNGGNLKYIDYYERALYNHILGSQHPGHGGLVYFTPMRPQHYRVYSNPGHTFWCCVGSGIENHAKYGEMIYTHDNSNLYINLFIPSELNWEEKGLALTQTTNYPETEETALKLSLNAPSEFTIFIRHPKWNDKAPLRVKVNGSRVKGASAPGEYFAITRTWKDGDRVEVMFDMYTYGEYFPDNSPYKALLYGPLVLAAETGAEDLDGIIADDSRMGHVAHGPLISREETPVMIIDNDDWARKITPVKGKPLTFQMRNLLYPRPAKELELIPFYRLHDARYIIYWEVSSNEGLAEKQEQLRLREQELMAIEAITIDQIDTGQQQPESDHNIRFYNSEAGVFKDRHWRHAAGWFSYELNDPGNEAATLRVTYSGSDRDRNFDILLNNQLLTTVRLDGSYGAGFEDIDYPIPAEIVSKNTDGKMDIRFRAHENSKAGGVFFIRLMKSE